MLWYKYADQQTVAAMLQIATLDELLVLDANWHNSS